MNLQMKNPATPASVQPGLCNTNQQGNSTTKPPKKWQRRQNPKTATKRRPYSSSDLKVAHYEWLKASLTAGATTSAEYQAACIKAARLAGV